ncbi:MAG TPA: penicillin-binding protein 2 [Burkholderiaceae bacterium]|nr:penicillin-binding protein 2 [Burkholderiaceae bacterium]
MKQPAGLRSMLGVRAPRAGAGRGERLAFHANPLLAVKVPAWRSRLLLLLLFCSFAALAGRALWLQGGGNTSFLQRQGEARFVRMLDVPATRGSMTDRNGVVLAASLPAKAIWASPEDVDASAAELARLARLLEMPLAELKRKLADEDKHFVYLARQVDPSVADRIADLKLNGIGQHRSFRRQYPEGATVAHVVGFTGVDDKGQEGVELALDAELAATQGRRRAIRDNLHRYVEEDWLQMPVDGNDVALSLDNRIQYLAFTAVREAVQANQAHAGAAIVLDARSGEVLALANWPSFDPNERNRRVSDAARNRALTDTFEPGSTLKPFSIAAALESGAVTPQQTFQTAPGSIRIADRVIRDSHPHGLLTVEQIVAKSSNVGTVQIAMQLPAQRLWDVYTSAGFGQPVRIGFPGAAAGRLRPARTWREVEQATISYGYGISVSLMQLARAYLVFARDGDIVPVSLTRQTALPASVPVLRPETAHAIRHMLEMAASEEGTAPQARISGYRVAGKTGTARKVIDGRYVNEYVASFAGFAPASDPRIVVAVMVDDPGAGRYYAADVAAPIFARIATGSLRTLQVAPDALPGERDQMLAQTERPRAGTRGEGL